MVPVVLVVAVNSSVLPEHIGELLPVVGNAGGAGSARTKGPTLLEIHPLSVTVIFE